tara:strand:+ start:2894 stop:3193 length:300 start_codon:yes stop_codon:yes gene_type:complete
MAKFNRSKVSKDKLADTSDFYIFSFDSRAKEIENVSCPINEIGGRLSQGLEVRFTFNPDEWDNARYDEFLANELVAYDVKLTKSETQNGWFKSLVLVKS